MKGILKYAAAVLMTFLPPRYRTTSMLRGPAMVSGILQILVAVGILVYRLAQFYWQDNVLEQSGLSPDLIYEAANQIGGRAAYGSGIFLLADFISRPVNAFFIYLIFEGVMRTMSALVGHQVFGTLPLYAISGIHTLLDRQAYKRDLGELIPDEIVRGGEKQPYAIKVYSCRPKLNWNPYMTVEFEGEFYQMFKEEPGSSPRRFVYYLRKNPTGRIVVKVDHYKVDDVLKTPSDKWAGTPRIRDKVLPKRKVVVPDEVVRGGERQGYDWKIYCCEAKADWNYYVTIEFEGQLYQIFKEEAGPEPFLRVYYLRKNPVGRPAAVVKQYQRL